LIEKRESELVFGVRLVVGEEHDGWGRQHDGTHDDLGPWAGPCIWAGVGWAGYGNVKEPIKHLFAYPFPKSQKLL
jgi:hypothetical protein